MSTTYPDTRNARSTCASGAITAEYTVASALGDASTETSRTAIGLRASALRSRPVHPSARMAAVRRSPATVVLMFVFIDLCRSLFQNRPAPPRDPSALACSGDSPPQDSTGSSRPRSTALLAAHIDYASPAGSLCSTPEAPPQAPVPFVPRRSVDIDVRRRRGPGLRCPSIPTPLVSPRPAST